MRGLTLSLLFSGPCQLAGAASRVSLSVSVSVRPGVLARALQDQPLAVAGTLAAPGLASGVPATGTIRLSRRDRTVSYDLAFTGDHGQPYELRGREPLGWRSLLANHGDVAVEILDSQGALVARCRLRRRGHLRPVLEGPHTYRTASP